MNPLELRAIIAVVLALLSGWGGYTLASHHYERVMALDKLARDEAVQTQQVKTISDLKAQKAATQAAEQKYVDLQTRTDGLADQLTRSVSEYAALRRSVLPASTRTASGPDAARQGAASNTELAGLVRQATEACLGDAAELTGLQTWAATSSTSP